MSEKPFHAAVKHPIRLEPHQADAFSDDVAITATDSVGNKVTIIASRARWDEALMLRFTAKPSPAEIARRMYEAW